MTKQLCFRGLKPPLPTLRTPTVARRIAERIVAEVNLDEFYWTKDDLSDRVADVAEEIMRCGRPATVFDRLRHKQWPLNDKGELPTEPYGWDGIDQHCRHIADDIAAEEVARAGEEHKRHYGA